MKVSITTATLLFIITRVAGADPEDTGDSPFIPPTTVGNGKCYKSSRPTDPTPIPTQNAPAQNAPAESGSSTVDPQSCLGAHNSKRATKGVPPLSWSSKLASHAQDWANVKQGSMQHASGTGEGENLASGSAGMTCTHAVEMWFSEGQTYRPGNLDHYTQVMWKETTELGCGYLKGLLVCRYYPPGNRVGKTPY